MTRRVATAAAKPASDPEALVDELAIKIQSRILAGEYVGEEWLRQEALATEFGVSRTPVREALRKLEASGFLTLVPHRGAQARILWVNDNPGGNLFERSTLALALQSSNCSPNRFPVAEQLEHEREVLRPSPPTGFDFAGSRPVRVALDGYLKLGGNFYRAPVALVHQRVELRFDRDHVWIRRAGATVARYARSWDRGQWFPPPRLRPEPPAPEPVRSLAVSSIAPPELADYAELCA
jgi:hypothetical protein